MQLQQIVLVSNLVTTAALAAFIMVVTRHEIGYAWWKAVAVALIGLLTGFAVGGIIGVIPASVEMRMGLSVVGIILVAAAVCFGGRFLLRMTWRDSIVIGVIYVLIQTLVPFLIFQFS